MLGGCLALTNSLSWVSIPRERLLTLIATLNVYEIALLALAWFLIGKRRLLRDGAMLLLLEAIFLADFTFLNAEISTLSLGLGLTITAILLLAAAVKLAVALYLLGIQRISREYWLLLGTIAITGAIPLLFTWIGQGNVGARHFYLMWWIAGGMLGAFAMFWKQTALAPSALSIPLRVYIAAPWLSLATHLGILHYVYDQSFLGADSTPVLLGFALLLNRVTPRKLIPRRDIQIMQLMLSVAAVLVSFDSPRALSVALNHSGSMQVTPFGVALATGYLTFIYCFFRSHWIGMLITGAVAASAPMFGPTMDDIESFFQSVWNFLCDVWALVPKTQEQWGIAAVISSFGFLGLGALISLAKRPNGDAAPPASPDNIPPVPPSATSA
jgi:hypothetical protein